MQISKSYYAKLTAGLLSCLLFFACSKETPVKNAPLAVDFVVGHAKTKAPVPNADAITSLGLFGYSTGTVDFDMEDRTQEANLFENTHATRTPGGHWNYGPPYVYWPVDLTIKNSFFAYSPHAALMPDEADFGVVFGAMDTGTPGIVYTVPTHTAQHVDLLYSEPVLDINRNTNSGKVTYVMKHATSWISFLINPQQKSNPNEKYTIKTLNFSVIEGFNRGLLDLGTGEWRQVGASTVLYFVSVNPAPVTVNTLARAELNGECLMLLPQTINKEDHDPIIYLSFTYDNGTGGVQSNDDYFFTIPFPETILEPGCIITYILRISIDGVSVEFDSINTIDEWLLETYPEEPEVF